MKISFLFIVALLFSSTQAAYQYCGWYNSQGTTRCTNDTKVWVWPLTVAQQNSIQWDNLTVIIANFSQQILALQKDLLAANTRITTLQTQFANTQTQNTVMNTQISTVESNIQQVKDSVSSFKASMVNALTQTEEVQKSGGIGFGNQSGVQAIAYGSICLNGLIIIYLLGSRMSELCKRSQRVLPEKTVNIFETNDNNSTFNDSIQMEKRKRKSKVLQGSIQETVSDDLNSKIHFQPEAIAV